MSRSKAMAKSAGNGQRPATRRPADTAAASASAQASKPSRRGITSRPWWPALKRTLTFAFFGLIAWLIWNQAQHIEWGEVREAIGRYRAGTLALAAALAAASYAVYSSYDLLSRRYAGHTLGTRQVLGITFVCYAFNLNLGSLVGGLALRYRLYSRLGLDTPTIARIVSFSLTTNWLGYLLLAGGVFLLYPLELPPSWKLDSGGLRILGGAMVAAALAYLLACAFARKRSVSLRGHEFELPPLRLALMQLAVSSLNWLLIASIVYVLLQQKIAFPAVLAVMLVAAVAGVITHVPAGLGVLEAVFVALLSHKAPATHLIAALLAYRAIYYLAPLAVASVAYLRAELRHRRSGATDSAAGAEEAAAARPKQAPGRNAPRKRRSPARPPATRSHAAKG